MALAIPLHSKMSPDGLLKSLLVTRNSDMMLLLTVGLYRASMFVPLNEQGMVVEGERIRIALEELLGTNTRVPKEEELVTINMDTSEQSRA